MDKANFKKPWDTSKDDIGLVEDGRDFSEWIQHPGMLYRYVTQRTIHVIHLYPPTPLPLILTFTLLVFPYSHILLPALSLPRFPGGPNGPVVSSQHNTKFVLYRKEDNLNTNTETTSWNTNWDKGDADEELPLVVVLADVGAAGAGAGGSRRRDNDAPSTGPGSGSSGASSTFLGRRWSRFWQRDWNLARRVLARKPPDDQYWGGPGSDPNDGGDQNQDQGQTRPSREEPGIEVNFWAGSGLRIDDRVVPVFMGMGLACECG